MYIGRTQKCYRSQALAPSFRSVPILSSHEQYRRRCGRLVPKVRHSRFTTLSSSFCAALISNALDMFDILSLHFFEMSIFVLVTNHVSGLHISGIARKVQCQKSRPFSCWRCNLNGTLSSPMLAVP